MPYCASFIYQIGNLNLIKINGIKSHRVEMSDDLIQILEKKRLNKEKVLELLGTAAVEMECTKDNEFSYFLKQGSVFNLGMPFTYLSIKFDDSGNYISSNIYSFEF